MEWRHKPISKNVEDRSHLTIDPVKLQKQEREAIKERREKALKEWRRRKGEEWERLYKGKMSLDEYLKKEWQKEVEKFEQRQKEILQNPLKLDDILRDLSETSNPMHNHMHKVPDNLQGRKKDKVQLTQHRQKYPLSVLPEKGPERVDKDPLYNPFDIDGNGFTDLEGEAFIFKNQPQRLKNYIRAAGRDDFFKHIFEPA